MDATVIQGYLTRVSEAEESFVEAIGQQMPAISEKLNVLGLDGDEPASRMAALDVSLQDVARLRIEAQQVNTRVELASLEAALRQRVREREAILEALRRGRGLAMHCQRAGSQSERMEIRVAANGSVALHVSTLATGQGHETMFAQMISTWLSVPIEHVRVFQGDTDKLLYGRGTFAQRSMNAGGSALRLAADEVIRKGKAIAGWMLEASVADIAFEGGQFRVQGTDRAVNFADVARTAYLPVGLPSELNIGLDGVGTHAGPNNFPNGCMIAEVETRHWGTVTVGGIPWHFGQTPGAVAPPRVPRAAPRAAPRR